MEVREVERQLVARAKTSVIRVLAFRQRRELLRNQIALASEFSEKLSAASQKGEGSALDTATARLEAAGLSIQIRQLDAEEAAAVGELKPLLEEYWFDAPEEVDRAVAQLLAGW